MFDILNTNTMKQMTGCKNKHVCIIIYPQDMVSVRSPGILQVGLLTAVVKIIRHQW